MLSAKKRNIYIGIIVLCLLGIVALFGFNFGSVTDAPPLAQDAPPPSSVSNPDAAASGSYPRPVVFPQDREFDLSIFDSSTFQALKAIGDITLQEGELGNDNPF